MSVAPAIASAVMKTAAGKSISDGVWTLVGLVIVTIGTVAVAYIKGWGPWREKEIAADEKLRDEMWKDIAELKLSKQDQGRRLTMAETKLAEQESQIGQLRFLVRLLNNELERVSPGNTIAKEVRLVMDNLNDFASARRASSEDMGAMVDSMSKLCVVKGVNE